MSQKKNTSHNDEKKINPESEPVIMADIIDDEAENSEAEAQEESTETKMAQELEDARAQIEKEKKEYLFLMAEFDNYRKRVVREKADLIKNASEKTLLGLLPIVDDFERGLDATKNESGTSSAREGMELIYNKIVKYLEDNGVKAMDTTGAAYDADMAEAIATVPAPDENSKGKVLDTVQKGYTLNDKVLRHTKVVVGE